MSTDFAAILFDAFMPTALLLLAVFFAVTGLKLYVPKIKGWIGEQEIRDILSGLNEQAYTCFHDVLLPTREDTTQIDHIVIVGYTCFVIETKAYAGWIFGNEKAKTWTQSLNKHSRFSFQNPIRQNYKHIKAIEPYLEGLKVVGLVVFTEGKFKGDRIDGVLYSKELKAYLLKYNVDKSFDHSAQVHALQKAMITDKAAHQAHVRRLQDKYGGRWRAFIANSFLAASLVLVAVWFGYDSKVPVQPSIAPQPRQALMHSNHTATQKPAPKPSQKQKLVIKALTKPPVVNGFAEGKVIIPSGRGFRILKVGEQTRDGWVLNVASTTSAEFSNAKGQSIKVPVKQRGVQK